MQIERVVNAKRNIIYGFFLKSFQLIIPFFIRTIIIQVLGIEYLGLNCLFVSILQVLNLAELGVGSAMVYSMYKPIAEDDAKTINALLKLYKKYYNIIGSVILCIGVSLMPFLPKLVSSNIPNNINIYILYCFNLMATISSYWLFSYKSSLLLARQRVDIISIIALLCSLSQYFFQIFVLIIFKNYYVFLIIAVFMQILQNIFTAFFVKILYPQYKPEGILDANDIKTINTRVKDLFTSKIGEVIVNSVDSIVISTFLGLSTLAIYNNYYIILSTIIGFVLIIFNSCIAGIGNSLLVETSSKNYEIFNAFTFIISWISCICVCCLLNLYQPFMKLWVGEQYLLPFKCVVCFCVYFYIRELNQVLILYKDAAGIWHKDRWRPLVTALTNLILNLSMVQFMGIYGILLSTILSTILVGMPWVIHNVFSLIFKKSCKIYIRYCIKYMAVTLLSCFTCFWIIQYIVTSLIVSLIIRLFICLIISNIIFIYTFRKTPQFKYAITIINKVANGKIMILVKGAQFYERNN
jgi:O-antigen/teichoic acid export membrane protein